MAMSTENISQRFKGEISAQDEISTNAKGGSVTATLKQSITKAFGIADRIAGGALGKSKSYRLAAATIEVDKTNRLVLMAQASLNASKFVVHRTGEHSVEISIEGHEEERISEADSAFVELKRQQFLRQELSLTDAMTADEFETMSGQLQAMAAARHSVT